ERDLILHVSEIDATESFGHAQLLRMRMTAPVEPRPIVEAGGFDDQRVPLPSANGIAQPRRVWIRRQLPSIHVDLPVPPRAVLVQQGNNGGRLHDPGSRAQQVRRTARAGGGYKSVPPESPQK